MPRVIFTDRTVRTLKIPEKDRVEYFDARLPCFGLRVSAEGSRSWIVLYRFGGRLRRFTFGSYPNLSLAEARARARAALHDVACGLDPAAVKRTAREAETFGELATEYLEKHAKPKKRSWREDQRMLNRELLPTWRHIKAVAITRAHVRDILDGVVKRGSPIQANHILALARKVFNFAIERDIVPFNPCQRISKPGKSRPRDRVLSADEIRTLWAALTEERHPIAAFFKLHLLTAQRSGEILGMRWDELDFESRWWTIAAERAKNGLAHRVPLSPAAVAILSELRSEQQEKPSPWVLPAPRGRGGCVGHVQKAVQRLRRRTKLSFTAHDLRRTAASHMASMGVPRLVIAKILNHVETSVTAIYDRHSYDPEKRRALDAWSEQLTTIVIARPARPETLVAESDAIEIASTSPENDASSNPLLDLGLNPTDSIGA